MIKVQCLTDGLTSWNSWGFLAPLIRFKEDLKASGIDLEFIYTIEDLSPYSITLLDSKFMKRFYQKQSNGVDLIFAEISRKSGRVIFSDNSDSSGIFLTEPFEFCDLYIKGTIFQDLRHYQKQYYGGRVYSDINHLKSGIVDSQPFYSPKLTKANLKKIRLGWNPGFLRYSRYSIYLQRLFRSWNVGRVPKVFVEPNVYDSQRLSEKNIRIHARFFKDYQRASVAYLRKNMADQLKKRGINTDKLGRRDYWKELRHSRLVFSPFGLGEITLKDFEAFSVGSALVKPDMSNIQTWPNFYIPFETYIPHRLDLGDLDGILQSVDSDPSRYEKIAKQAQRHYKTIVSSRQSPSNFVSHFRKIIEVL